MSNEPKWKFTTRDEIEEVRSALKIYFPNKSSDRAAFNTVCDIALKALDPAWCRRCGVFHDAELGETCPKKLQPEARAHSEWNAAMDSAAGVARSLGNLASSQGYAEKARTASTIADMILDLRRQPQRDAQGEQK